MLLFVLFLIIQFHILYSYCSKLNDPFWNICSIWWLNRGHGPFGAWIHDGHVLLSRTSWRLVHKTGNCDKMVYCVHPSEIQFQPTQLTEIGVLFNSKIWSIQSTAARIWFYFRFSCVYYDPNKSLMLAMVLASKNLSYPWFDVFQKTVLNDGRICPNDLSVPFAKHGSQVHPFGCLFCCAKA